MSLDPDRQRKLLAAARLLESDKSGEQEAALRAMLRLLPEGMTVASLLEKAFAVPRSGGWNARPSIPEWQAKARDIIKRSHKLTAKELAFVTNMAGAQFEPSQSQLDWLNDIAAKLETYA